MELAPSSVARLTGVVVTAAAGWAAADDAVPAVPAVVPVTVVAAPGADAALLSGLVAAGLSGLLVKVLSGLLTAVSSGLVAFNVAARVVTGAAVIGVVAVAGAAGLAELTTVSYNGTG